MSWKSILGLVLLLGGTMGLYTAIANTAAIKPNMSPAAVELGCIIWMAVGVFLIMKGMIKKPE